MVTPADTHLDHELFKTFEKLNDAKFGLICIPCLLNQLSSVELKEFIDLHQIPLLPTTQTRIGMIERIFTFYMSDPSLKSRLKELGASRLDLLGQDTCNFPNFTCDISEFDFITKTELQNIFGDYCADLGITVFKAPENNQYGLDLFLTKKDPLLKTETVFVSTASDIEARYKDIFFNLERTGEISDWQLLVTTPLAAYKIGLERLKNDMKKLGAWLYIVDPKQQQIFGVQKGPKSKRKTPEAEENFIRKLPSTPIRAPSQVVKLSKFKFSEKNSYKPKEISQFYIPTTNHPAPFQSGDAHQKFRSIFRTFIIMTKESGLSLCSYASEVYKVEDVMISGFITAIDSFVQELSGSGNLKEIDYQDFKITALVGNWVKIILITAESADEEFKERLAYYLNSVERIHLKELQTFIKTGNQSEVNQEGMIELAKKILLI